MTCVAFTVEVFVQIAGYSNAMRYVLTGEEFDAAEAAMAMMQRRPAAFKGR